VLRNHRNRALEFGACGADSGLAVVCAEKVRDLRLAIRIESSRAGSPGASGNQFASPTLARCQSWRV
jgi:hypothetical protein